jgi:phage anti-repressor protein
LHSLYQATSGNTSKAVDFKDLVKKLGFHGNYGEIFKMLSGEGWIVESSKPDFVSISHWGAAEVKKSLAAASTTGNDSNSESKKDSSLALNTSRELSALLENFVRKPERDRFSGIESKLADLQTVIARIKDKLS